MKILFAFIGLVSALVGVQCAFAPLIPTATYIRSPSQDSAIIQSDRLGGNFAYSTVEGHAFQTVQPLVRNIYRPVGVTYSSYPYSTVQTIPSIQTQPIVFTQQSTLVPTFPSYQISDARQEQDQQNQADREQQRRDQQQDQRDQRDQQRDQQQNIQNQQDQQQNQQQQNQQQHIQQQNQQHNQQQPQQQYQQIYQNQQFQQNQQYKQ